MLRRLPLGLGCKIKANCPLVGPGLVGEMPSVGGLSKGSYSVFTRVLEKTTETSEGLDRQVRPGIEPGTSCLPILSAKQLRH